MNRQIEDIPVDWSPMNTNWQEKTAKQVRDEVKRTEHDRT